MHKFLLAGAAAALLASSAHALTLQSGQIIGPDGETYDGASPQKQEALIQQAQNGGEIAGVTGSSVFVVVGDTITFVPVDDIRDKRSDTVRQIVGDEVIQNVTGVDEITFADVENAQMLAEKTGVPIEELVSVEGIEGLDPEVIADIAAVSEETGIDFDNLVAVNTVISQLPDDQFNQITEELSILIEEGFADEINATLDELSEIPGGLENLFQYNSLEECEADGGQNCAATAAAIEGAG